MSPDHTLILFSPFSWPLGDKKVTGHGRNTEHVLGMESIGPRDTNTLPIEVPSTGADVTASPSLLPLIALPLRPYEQRRNLTKKAFNWGDSLSTRPRNTL